MALSRGPKIVTSGLVLALDAADKNSYPGSGAIWYDLSGNNNNFTLYNTPTFNSSGYFVLNGTNQYFRSTNTLNLGPYNSVSVCLFFKPLTYPSFGQVKSLYELSNDFNSFQYGFIHSYNDTSLAQNYEIFTSIKGNVGYNIGTWNKSNYSDLNWKNSVGIFDKSQSSAETSLYVNGNIATVIQNPAVEYSNNNTNNFGDDYFYIGSRGGSNLFSDINLSTILIYNRVLSTTEIAQNYNAQKTRFGL
jgi:hypothetical protein